MFKFLCCFNNNKLDIGGENKPKIVVKQAKIESLNDVGNSSVEFKNPMAIDNCSRSRSCLRTSFSISFNNDFNKDLKPSLPKKRVSFNEQLVGSRGGACGMQSRQKSCPSYGGAANTPGFLGQSQ